MDAATLWVTILVALVAGSVSAVVTCLLMEAWFDRKDDNQITETEFHEDETAYAVPEMEVDCFTEDDEYVFADDDGARRRGRVVW